MYLLLLLKFGFLKLTALVVVVISILHISPACLQLQSEWTIQFTGDIQMPLKSQT